MSAPGTVRDYLRLQLHDRGHEVFRVLEATLLLLCARSDGLYRTSLHRFGTSVVSIACAANMCPAPFRSQPCPRGFTTIRGAAAMDPAIRKRSPVMPGSRTRTAFCLDRPGFGDNFVVTLPVQNPCTRLSECQLPLLAVEPTQRKAELRFVGQAEEVDGGVEAIEMRMGDPQGFFEFAMCVAWNMGSFVVGLRKQHAQLGASGVCSSMPIGKYRVSSLHGVARPALASRKQPTLHRDQLQRLGTAGAVRNGSQRRLILHVAPDDDVRVRVTIGNELIAEQSLLDDRHELQQSRMRILRGSCIEVPADQRKKAGGFTETRRQARF